MAKQGRVPDTMGDRLKAARMARGWSYRDMSALINVSHSTVGNSAWVLVDSLNVIPPAVGVLPAGETLWLRLYRSVNAPVAVVLTVAPTKGKRRSFRYEWD